MSSYSVILFSIPSGFLYVANQTIPKWFQTFKYIGFFPYVLNLKADDTYIQLKKDLEYLDLKVRF